MGKPSEVELQRLWEDARVVYQALLEDIKLYKNQQWLITYYVFAIYFALASFIMQLDWIGFHLYQVISLLIILALTGGIVLINKYRLLLSSSREKKNKVICILAKEIINILYPAGDGNENERDFSTILEISLIIGGIFILALPFL